MGANMSKVFEFVNDVHIAIGSGILGIIIFIYNGMSSETFRTLCIGGTTTVALFYLLSSQETVSVTPEKVIFITGCDSGLGLSLALHANELGFTVIAGCLSITSDGAKKLLKDSSKKITIIELDITDVESIKRCVHDVQIFLSVNEPCVLWAFVNNAGVMVFGEFEWLTERLIYHQLNVNLRGTMLVTKYFLPLLRKYSGRIITISSHCAQQTLPGLSVYGATKAALKAWNDGLRVELSKYGVPVISFIPGSFVQQSNIMAKQNENVFEMQSNLTEEQLKFYGNYFKEYNAYLSALSGKRKPRKIDDDTLYEIFDQTLLEKHPFPIYIHESWKYKIYHTLFKISPWYIRDRLITYFVQMPQWKQDKKINRISNVIG